MWANSWSDDKLVGRWPSNCPTSSMLWSINTSFWNILIMPRYKDIEFCVPTYSIIIYTCMHARIRTHAIPSAVRKRKTSPSLQNMSHTLQATSRGNVLVYNVNILRWNNHNNGDIWYYLPLQLLNELIALPTPYLPFDQIKLRVEF